MSTVNIADFFQAIEQGDVQTVEKSLHYDTNLCNAEDGNGLTALAVAAHYGHLDVVQLLLNFGADINALSNSKVSYIPSNTPLHAAIAGTKSMKVITFLLDQGANVHIPDSSGYTPLQIAAFDGDEVVTGLLLQYGSDIGFRNPLTNLSAVDIATERSNVAFLKAIEDYSGKRAE